jgi:hypothetical protein
VIIRSTYRIRRWTFNDFTGLQKLECVTKLLGITVFVSEVDREVVPSWVTIQLATLGSSDWKSRLFEQHAHLLGKPA